MSAPLGMQDRLALPPDSPPAPRRTTHSHAPLVAAVIVCAALTGWVYLLCLNNTGGEFVYPLDDTYIHLALARTLADHGIWGMNAHDGFASAASSLAWPLQLAALIKVFGPQEWLPLALNALYGGLALAGAYVVLMRAGASRRFIFWMLILVILFTSLPVLVLLGMEHTMQAAVGVWFAIVAAQVLATDRSTWGQMLLLGALSLLATATRYEGMFAVLAVALAALLLRRWRELAVVSVLGALPIVAFGLYSVAQGSLWLPNPIAVKSEFYGIHSLRDFLFLMAGPKLGLFLETIAVYVPLLLALAGVVIDAATRNRLGNTDRLFVVIVVCTAGMHLFGARTGWFTRYEAYLVLMTVVAAGVAWRPLLQNVHFRFGAGDERRAVLVGAGVVLLILVLLGPVIQRMNDGLFNLPIASKNIHDQQIQMARFVKQYYDGQSILINDLGAIAFYTDARPVDMAGLATLEVARAVIARENTITFLDKLAHDRGARIAIIYTSWLPARPPHENWLKVGSWTIRNNVICGDETVDFYVLDRNDAQAVETLTANLRAFADSLPKDVTQSGY